ncbi:MAG: exodeoxyribonuclease VII small subunit [Oscillospiraceae bacterium]|jgi:exodeoxyribonuclease VII small subunit|nr:exodeoxyribonuclease VII small subunit [Oscillospiraceae bacterium]
MQTDITFEQSLARLEEIVRALERGDAPLDAALALFEEGTALVRGCSKQLDEAEQKITLLIKGADGAPVESEFAAAE